MILLFPNCEKNYYYETDPRFFNDAMHGNIVGKVIQTTSNTDLHHHNDNNNQLRIKKSGPKNG